MRIPTTNIISTHITCNGKDQTDHFHLEIPSIVYTGTLHSDRWYVIIPHNDAPCLLTIATKVRCTSKPSTDESQSEPNTHWLTPDNAFFFAESTPNNPSGQSSHQRPSVQAGGGTVQPSPQFEVFICTKHPPFFPSTLMPNYSSPRIALSLVFSFS